MPKVEKLKELEDKLWKSATEFWGSITSALSTNIPVTFRGYSAGFSVVSAHLAGNRFNKEWISLLKQKNHTVVVLMGLSRVKDILKEAKEGI